MGKTKTKLSSIVDFGTVGVLVGTELEIERSTAKSLRKAMYQASQGMNGNIQFKLISGNYKEGHCVFLLSYLKDNDSEDGESRKVRYEFKVNGKNTFLNVGCNPTILAVGNNSIPIIFKGMSVFESFKTTNRLPYYILDRILKDYGFQWGADDRKSIDAGNISLKQMQIAFYSGDLGEYRNKVMMYVKALYGGYDSDGGTLKSMGKHLNLEVKDHDEDPNVTIAAKSGKNKEFSFCLYRNEELERNVTNKDRTSSLIRYDCTLHGIFLIAEKINTIAKLEDKYYELCEEHGYDRGFTRWLFDTILERIKLRYLVSLVREDFVRSFQEAENKLYGTDSLVGKIFTAWVDDKDLTNQTQLAAEFKVSQPAINKAMAKFKLEYPLIDIGIPFAYFDALYYNLSNYMATRKERRAEGFRLKGSNHKKLDRDELNLRADQLSKEIKGKVLGSDSKVLSFRRMTAKKVSIDNIYIYQQLEN